MIRRIRWRFILAAMMAFASVIALLCILVNAVNFYVTTDRLDDTIASILNTEEAIPQAPGNDIPMNVPPMALPDLEANYMMRFFIVRCNESSEVSSVFTDFIASVDEATAAEYASQALSSTAEKGYIREYRNAKKTSDSGTAILFLNAGRELQYMHSLLGLTLAVSAAALLLVFILVVLFSKKAMRPFEKNIEKQKQFITDASHELKTPITSISASVDVIALEHGVDEWTENIRSQTSRMTKLVNELVILSRLDEEIPLPSKEPFSLSNAAWEITEIFQIQAKACGKDFTADIQDNVTVYGDKATIQKILSVLLDNAVRYSDDHGIIKFTVSEKRNKAMIEVYNTCDYENPPDVSRLFDRFYRPDDSRNRETGGTGVGLAIAKAGTELHGGTIEAICPDGKSMTIRVIL